MKQLTYICLGKYIEMNKFRSSLHVREQKQLAQLKTFSVVKRCA